MCGEYMLVQKVEAKAESQFDTGGDTDKRGAVYRVLHAPAESSFSADSLVLLKPGTYPGFFFENEMVTQIETFDVLAKVTEGKK
jgi:hypothetical protein